MLFAVEPLPRHLRRYAMQAVTLQECLTFFFSVGVIVYLWLQ
jgi:hypothetical protein